MCVVAHGRVRACKCSGAAIGAAIYSGVPRVRAARGRHVRGGTCFSRSMRMLRGCHGAARDSGVPRVRAARGRHVRGGTCWVRA